MRRPLARLETMALVVDIYILWYKMYVDSDELPTKGEIS